MEEQFNRLFNALENSQQSTLKNSKCDTFKHLGNVEQDEIVDLLGCWTPTLEALHATAMQLVAGIVKAVSIEGLPEAPIGQSS